MKETDGNIDYEPGVEMTIELTKPLTWSGCGSASGPNVTSRRGASAVRTAGRGERAAVSNPRGQTSEGIRYHQHHVSGITQETWRSAFQAAGWSTAEQLNAKSKLETFRAMTEQRGYKEGSGVGFVPGWPCAPDLVFQESKMTRSTMRHHLRIWHRRRSSSMAKTFGCVPPHDIGIDFSEENRTFIHKVDGDYD